MSDVSLLQRRGDLSMARKKVAEDGYVFRKGSSRSKVYGSESGSSEPTPKRPKYDSEMRQERMKTIDDELKDVSKLVEFKNTRLAKAELNQKYQLCEQIMEEVMSLKARKRELERERKLFERKQKLSERRSAKQKLDNRQPEESESSETENRSESPLFSPKSPSPIMPSQRSRSSSQSVTPPPTFLPPTSPALPLASPQPSPLSSGPLDGGEPSF